MRDKCSTTAYCKRATRGRQYLFMVLSMYEIDLSLVVVLDIVRIYTSMHS